MSTYRNSGLPVKCVEDVEFVHDMIAEQQSGRKQPPDTARPANQFGEVVE